MSNDDQPNARPTAWQQVIGHCERLNEEGGTQRVSSQMLKRRRQRDRQREKQTADADALHPAPAQGWEERLAQKMQDAMNGFGGPARP